MSVEVVRMVEANALRKIARRRQLRDFADDAGRFGRRVHLERRQEPSEPPEPPEREDEPAPEFAEDEERRDGGIFGADEDAAVQKAWRLYQRFDPYAVVSEDGEPDSDDEASEP